MLNGVTNGDRLSRFTRILENERTILLFVVCYFQSYSLSKIICLENIIMRRKL